MGKYGNSNQSVRYLRSMEQYDRAIAGLRNVVHVAQMQVAARQGRVTFKGCYEFDPVNMIRDRKDGGLG